MKTSPLILALAVIALGSCTSNTPLKPGSTITASIAVPEMERHMRFVTPGLAVASVVSPLGELMAESGSGPKGEMRDFFAAELTRCLTEALNKRGKVRIVPGAPVRLETKVTQWGYWGRPGRLDGNLIPVGVMHFKLVDASGQTLAAYRTPGKGQGFGVAYDGAPVRDAKELEGNPTQLRAGLSWLANRTAQDLANGL